MDAPDSPGSCSRSVYSTFQLPCDKNPTNNTVYCQRLSLIVFLFQADCYITKVFFPLTGILIVIGTILNLFSLYCFYKMNKRNSQNVYLSVLSLVDTINLHINFTLPLLRQIVRFDDMLRNARFLCRLTGVLTEFFLIFPTWIVVLLTFECLISVTWPLKRRSSYSQSQAKISIAILAILVLALSLYRLNDLKGIDQVSVFSVVACNGTHRPNVIMTTFNLLIWAIIPECLTLIMSLVIIYKIKLATKQFERDHSNARQLKYNQATKTVLLISILFLIFHTPTGILIALNLFYDDDQQKRTLGIIIILVSRKVTITLYEISLSCKFFIYQRTFQNFRVMLRRSFAHFIHRQNSAKLGQDAQTNPFIGSRHNIIHFRPCKQPVNSLGSPSESFSKQVEEYHKSLNNRQRRTSLTSVSRTNREHQPLNVVMNKSNERAHVIFSTTPDLLRANREKKRSLWLNKPQISL